MVTTQSVATAITSHSLSTRWGSSMRVFSQSQPPLLITSKPCSIQARKAYHTALPASGGKSVKRNHGSSYPSAYRASSVRGIFSPV